MTQQIILDFSAWWEEPLDSFARRELMPQTDFYTEPKCDRCGKRPRPVCTMNDFPGKVYCKHCRDVVKAVVLSIIKDRGK